MPVVQCYGRAAHWMGSASMVWFNQSENTGMSLRALHIFCANDLSRRLFLLPRLALREIIRPGQQS
jgi:hypothetical protein